MICERCNADAVIWCGPLHAPAHSRCEQCGGINCQRIEAEDDEPCPECGDGEYVPANGYWLCPTCDAEWPEGEG